MHISRRAFMATAAAASAASFAAQAQEAAAGKTYKAVVIGDTKQGGYGHAMHRIFTHRPDVKVVGLADPDEAGRAKCAAECGAERTYADYREMLAKEQPNLAVIAPRWTVNHKEYLLACADAGSHGFTEKPLCVDMEEADAMVAAIEAKNLKWGIGYNYRMTPQVRHVRKLVVEDGLIGTLIEARGRGKEDQRAGGEDLVVLGAHVMDLMRFFMGDAQRCMADITHDGRTALPADVREASEPLGPILGNRVNALFTFKDGATGHFASMKNPGPEWLRFSINLYGTKGTITINLNRPVPVIKWLDESIWNSGVRGKAWQDVPDMPAYEVANKDTDTFIPNVDDLMAAIAEDRAPAASLQDGARAVEMVQAVFAAHTAGGKVDLPLPNRAHPLKNWTA
jgi:predicted dehydrogenase